MSNSPQAKTILILAANPTTTSRLEWDKEVREIDEALRRSNYREQFKLEQKLAVRARDFHRAILDFRPQIVHFCGHGTESDGIVLHDETGEAAYLGADELSSLFKSFGKIGIECVVLNACYSQEQAKAINKYVKYVIGMNRTVGDKASIAFAVAFYDGLAAGQNVENAYELGKSQMMKHGESQTPVLLKNEEIETNFYSNITKVLGKLNNVPGLPPNFLSRPQEIQALKNKVLGNNQTIAVTGASRKVGVQGMGGLGKTVLVTNLAHDQQVQQEFPDGIFWIPVGQEPSVTSLQMQLAMMLKERPQPFANEHEGRIFLSQQLVQKTCLIVLDDVWQKEPFEAFAHILGERCCLLVTTRDASLMTAQGAVEYRLNLLNDELALKLLAQWVNKEVNTLPNTALAVARECGNLPLALALCGAQVRDGTPWEDLHDALKEADLEFLDHSDYSVYKALKVSIDALTKFNSQYTECYQNLAIFPDDTSVPEAAILTFWQHTHQLRERDGRKLLTMLASKALLQTTGEAPKRLVTLHDLQYDYLRYNVGDLAHLHQELLAVYRKTCTDGWHTVKDDGYIHQRLVWHLEKAGKKEEIHSLLQEETEKGRNGWYEACDRLGQTAIFVTDVAHAWQLAEEMFEENPTQSIALQCRYALITTSLNSLAKNIPPALMAALVKEKLWTPAQGLAYAQQVKESGQLAQALSALAPYLPKSLLPVALAAARGIQDDSNRAHALSQLAPHLPEVLLEQALAAARGIQDDSNRAHALSQLAPHLP
ncbi:CHAT domain-containing protein, partial [Iningainema sp. BLCCT55]|nr:CHAT domain-containing protein [Iningainema tapete BLCC-T55]